MPDQLRVVPANLASPSIFDEIFGGRGSGHRCRCQRYRLARGETFAGTPVEERARRLIDQTAAGDAEASSTSGLIAYIGERPVGWVAVAPRTDYRGLCRAFSVPWLGREEDRTDASVWAITCLFVRTGYRRRGVSRALATAAVDFAKALGARAVEAYPIASSSVIEEELHVGTLPTYEAAGLVPVSRPTKRRTVVRVDFA